MLHGAKELPRPPQLQVLLRQHKAIRGALHNLHPLPGGLRPFLCHKNAVGSVFAAADAPPELVQLRQAKALGILHHHDAGVGHIDTYLDDGGCHQQLDFALIKLLHELLFFLLLQLPMHKAAFYAIEYAACQFLIDLLCRGQPRVLIHLNQRADHIGLPALFDFLQHKLINQLPAVPAPHKGPDRLSSRRQLADQGNLQIAIYRQGQRPRNRRSRHHQHIRHQPALLFQHCPLIDAEAVLLISHHQPQIGKGNILLNEGMGADDNIYLMGSQPVIHFLLRLFSQPPGQKGHPYAKGLQGAGEALKMLPCQYFRRCHHGSLKAVFHCLHQGQHGNHGLAGAYIPLHQPPHGHRPLHIIADILPCILLVISQPEGQT